MSDEALACEYQTAHVVINPQVAGTGLKIKCVEESVGHAPTDHQRLDLGDEVFEEIDL